MKLEGYAFYNIIDHAKQKDKPSGLSFPLGLRALPPELHILFLKFAQRELSPFMN
jgi:hypothetical protein